MDMLLSSLLLAPLLLAVLNLLLNLVGKYHVHKTPFLAGTCASIVWIPLFLFLCVEKNGFSPVGFLFDAIYGFVYIFCLIFLNWFVFTLTDVSMHIQILMQIYRNPNITREDLCKKYNKSIILANRVPRLLELRQLELKDGKLFLAGRSVRLGATVCVILRYLLGLPLHPEDAHHEN